MRLVAMVSWLLMVPVVNAKDKEPHPGYPPTMLLASASAEGGKVVVQCFRPGPVPPEVDEQGNIKPGDRYETEWVPLRPVILGETVQAFGVNGQPVDRQALLKALAKPQGVGVFYRNYNNDPLVPPAFYRKLFREGTLLLITNPNDLYNPPPGGPITGAP